MLYAALGEFYFVQKPPAEKIFMMYNKIKKAKRR